MLKLVKDQSAEFSITTLRELLAGDLQDVDTLIRGSLHSDVALINQLSHYIINSGGKRLRPMLVLLSANACRYQGDQHINLAAVIEFIHTATLLHDDVVDASQLRRGNLTANAMWGNEASVLVGDFLYSRAFEMMVNANDMRIMEIMSHTTNTIAEGEVLQLLNCGDAETTEVRYMDVISRKTARLFEAAAQIGAVLGNQPETIETALANYGLHLGIAFQLIDDVLDYSASPEDTGKNVGDDLAEGKPTLPLIRAIHQGTPGQARLLRRAIENGGHDNMQDVCAIIESTGAIPYTAKAAQREADLALEALAPLPESVYKNALYRLAEFSVNRNY
ncbi:MAG: polyprenyl synthetase family protein [Gammaproteobacteria bacterium]|nr:polyprenyl synthetase family protein [Gammaproteobacteria bacterium]